MWFITYIRRNVKKTLAKNNKNIMKVILIACFLLLVLKIFDGIAASSIEKKEEEKQKNRGYLSTEDLSDLESNVDLFIKYCEESVNKSYDMLTSECKEKLYIDEYTFKSDYCDVYFKKGSSYTKRFVKVSKGFAIYEVDILYSSIEEGTIEKYNEILSIAVDNKKINVNSFIDVKPINKSLNNSKISIEISDCLEYEDYMIYELTINNRSSEDIIIDSKQIVFYDDNLNEYTVEQLAEGKNNIIKVDEIRNIRLKIKKTIYSKRNINKIILNKIINSQENIEINL